MAARRRAALPPLLTPAFFARDPSEVARALVGQLLVRAHDDGDVSGRVVVRITETEAYLGPADTASHARHGKTPRNLAIWGNPGCVYIYRCYGIHLLLNLVAGRPDGGAAVLVRSAEVCEGLDVVTARRGAPAGAQLLAGPGKVAQGLALTLDHNFTDCCAPGPLEVRAGHASDAGDVLAGPRVGIDYANARDREAPLRFACAISRAVTQPRSLCRLERRSP